MVRYCISCDVVFRLNSVGIYVRINYAHQTGVHESGLYPSTLVTVL